MSSLDDQTKAVLRGRVAALTAAAEKAAAFRGAWMYPLCPKVIRAFVWAMHRGVDPAPDVAQVRFGTRELGAGGWADVREKVAYLAALSGAAR